MVLLGASVASAGDVNGDGYGDVILGAPGNGEAYAFLGSASGIAGGSAPNMADADYREGGDMGHAVASAGDVDGDGFGDLIIGAPLLDSGEPNEGAAFLYLGNGEGRLLRTSQFRIDGSELRIPPGGAPGTSPIWVSA